MNNLFTWLLLMLMGALMGCESPKDNTPPPAEPSILSPDKRYGDLFVAIQTGDVFPDSKTFVDCTPKYETSYILKQFEEQKGKPGFDLKTFTLDHFELPSLSGKSFASDSTRSVLEHIEALWPVLTSDPDIANVGSKIPLPKSYIMPGGRFGEIYYWDSYFTMLGLEASGKQAMIANMVANFSFLIDTLGHIPNGNRTYFVSRSQPPFFSMMVDLIAGEGKGKAIQAAYFKPMLKEHSFWMKGQAMPAGAKGGIRRVRLSDTEELNRYWDASPTPRQESYKEDLETVAESGREPEQVYRDLRAACESGWDFSSRWLRDPMKLSTIHTTEIIPVDLNCLLYHLEIMVARSAEASNIVELAEGYRERAESRKKAILKYCWDKDLQFFTDYDFVAEKSKGIRSLAGMFPMFMKIATQEQADAMAKAIETDFLKPGGVVSTLVNTGQQWDSPNGWAPLQWVTIQGLRNYGHNDLANEIKKRWIAINTKVYRNTGKMVEKYNVLDMELEAGGGEYPSQDGFGWTNGVLRRLLAE